MLDVRRLRVLKEVAAKGSFSAAAESLAYTQSAVSQQIAALEREAGLQLVERSARGVHLTDAGRVLVGHADVILRRLADAEAELEAMTGLRGGRLRLPAPPPAGGPAPAARGLRQGGRVAHARGGRALPRTPSRRRGHARARRAGRGRGGAARG